MSTGRDGAGDVLTAGRRFLIAVFLYVGVYCVGYAAGTPGTQLWAVALGGGLIALVVLAGTSR